MERNSFNPPEKARLPRKNPAAGFTLFEVIISTVILAIATVGLANVFVSAKQWIWHSRSRTLGGELGRYFLDPLQMQVRQTESGAGAQDGWDQINNTLYIPAASESRTWTGSAQSLDNIDYTPTYTVSRVRDSLGGDTGLRRVKLISNWTE